MQTQFKWGNYSRTGTIWGNVLISLTDNTVSHFQCGVHQCHSKWYRPDGFCPWWWFGLYQKSKPMDTRSTGKFSEYFQDHHFKLKLRKNAAPYKFVIFCTLGDFWFSSKKYLRQVKNLKIIFTKVISILKVDETIVPKCFPIFLCCT